MKFTDKFVLLSIERYERLVKGKENSISTENTEDRSTLEENKKEVSAESEIPKESRKESHVESEIVEKSRNSTENKPGKIQKVLPRPPGVPMQTRKRSVNTLKWSSLS